MDTLITSTGLKWLKKASVIVILSLMMAACGDGGSSSSTTTEERVTNLYAQFDAGTLSEEDLITQLKALGF